MPNTPPSLSKLSGTFPSGSSAHAPFPPLPAVLLAAGLSRRMGSSKALLPWGQGTLLGHVLEQARASGVLAPVILVLGPHTPPAVWEMAQHLRLNWAAHDAAEHNTAEHDIKDRKHFRYDLQHGEGRSENALKAPSPARVMLDIILAKQAALGQAESLKAGLARVQALCPKAPGMAVLLADQPFIGPSMLCRLHTAFAQSLAKGESCGVAPAFNGQRGNPVFLHHTAFAHIAKLCGDQGARSLLAVRPPHLVSFSDQACLTDIDTPEQYTRLLSLAASARKALPSAGLPQSAGRSMA